MAERQEAGGWSEEGESCGAAGPGMVDIGSWSCGATSNIVQELGARRLLTRSGNDGHAKAGAKTGGDLVIVKTQ